VIRHFFEGGGFSEGKVKVTVGRGGKTQSKKKGLVREGQLQHKGTTKERDRNLQKKVQTNLPLGLKV